MVMKIFEDLEIRFRNDFQRKVGTLAATVSAVHSRINACQPTSTSRNCGINPLEKQGKERRKEVGLEKTHKPSLLLLPDGISIKTMLGTDVVYISLSNYSCIYLLSK